jgi:hypothetical protein
LPLKSARGAKSKIEEEDDDEDDARDGEEWARWQENWGGEDWE